MPRRNTNAVRTTTQRRATHVVVDSVTGRILDHGTKSYCTETKDGLTVQTNSDWTRFVVRPIHK